MKSHGDPFCSINVSPTQKNSVRGSGFACGKHPCKCYSSIYVDSLETQPFVTDKFLVIIKGLSKMFLPTQIYSFWCPHISWFLDTTLSLLYPVANCSHCNESFEDLFLQVCYHRSFLKSVVHSIFVKINTLMLKNFAFKSEAKHESFEFDESCDHKKLKKDLYLQICEFRSVKLSQHWLLALS